MRSALPQYFQRHGVSRLLLNEGRQNAPLKKKFKDYPMGYGTSILPKCSLKKAVSPSSWPLIAPARWPSPNCIPAPYG